MTINDENTRQMETTKCINNKNKSRVGVCIIVLKLRMELMTEAEY